MKKLLSAFVKYPFYGKMFIVVLLVLGGIALMNMKKATFPMVESTTITVSVSYRGATPKEMEEGVATLVENAIRGIPGIKEFSSRSTENMSSITIEAVANYDMDELLSDVKNAVDGISNFPADAERPIVTKQRNKDMAMFLNLVSENSDLHELNQQANRIEDDLLASGFISQITINGIPQNMELVVELDETKLRAYELQMSEIQSAISSNNLDIFGGTIRNPREEIKVNLRQRSADIDDIKNIVVRTNEDGKILTIGEIADVRLTFAETPNGSYRDGKRAVSIMIQKLMNEDLEQISDFVHQYIDEYNQSHTTTKLTVTHDFMDNISTQLSTLVGNGILGVVLIIIMLSLLLNFRLSLWVAWGIPAGFLGMFIIAVIYGITINMISLFGMILIIGILVDDGVVIGENIFTHYEKGKSPRRAAIDGTMEVLPAVFTSVVTTMIAFMPLFFVEGHLKMMQDMAFVVVAVLLISLVEALFVLPGHLANPNVLKPLNNKSVYGRVRGQAECFIRFLNEKIYLPVLHKLVKNKSISIASVTGLVIITAGLFLSGKIAFVFFPGQPADHFTIDLAMKPGTNEEITKERLFKIEQAVWQANEELKKQKGDTIDYVASTNVIVGHAFSGTESGTNAGMLYVFLNSLTDTDLTDDDIKQKVTELTKDLEGAYKYAVGASSRFGAPVSYSLLSYNNDELEAGRLAFEQELEKISSLYNITNNSQLGSQEIRLELKPEAYILGFNNATLMQQVRNGFYGGLAQRMQEGKDEVWVYVRYPHQNRETIGQLEKMMIHTQQGDFPLERLANISKARSLNTINRYNGRREIRVDAYMKDQSENISPVLEDVDNVIIPKIEREYPGLTFEKQGQQKDSAEQMGSMVLYFGIAFLIIVLIIMIYFKSFSQGFMVLIMIPLGILGAVWGHAIHGEPISMMSLWGFIALSGTIINDAIVFISRFNQNMVRGMKLMDAVIDTGKSRFRPILLTTLTTYVGLMPLILANNPDARFLVPMSISLAYGILFGTMFILLILPVVMLGFNQLNVFYHKITGEKDASAESVEVAVINHNIDLTLKTNMEKDFE